MADGKGEKKGMRASWTEKEITAGVLMSSCELLTHTQMLTNPHTLTLSLSHTHPHTHPHTHTQTHTHSHTHTQTHFTVINLFQKHVPSQLKHTYAYSHTQFLPHLL